MNITLRQVEPRDEPFLFAAYASTRAQEMAMVPWNDIQREAFLKSQFAAQQADYNRRYPNAEHSIIVVDDEPAGISHVNENPTELQIIDLIVAPEHRSKGIGTFLLKDYCTRAEHADKPVRIHVESFNPSLKLFEGLGFSKVADEGVYCLLEWMPQAIQTSSSAQETGA